MQGKRAGACRSGNSIPAGGPFVRLLAVKRGSLKLFWYGGVEGTGNTDGTVIAVPLNDCPDNKGKKETVTVSCTRLQGISRQLQGLP
jgi:hypothetical protein